MTRSGTQRQRRFSARFAVRVVAAATALAAGAALAALLAVDGLRVIATGPPGYTIMYGLVAVAILGSVVGVAGRVMVKSLRDDWSRK